MKKLQRLIFGVTGLCLLAHTPGALALKKKVLQVSKADMQKEESKGGTSYKLGHKKQLLLGMEEYKGFFTSYWPSKQSLTDFLSALETLKTTQGLALPGSSKAHIFFRKGEETDDKEISLKKLLGMSKEGITFARIDTPGHDFTWETGSPDGVATPNHSLIAYSGIGRSTKLLEPLVAATHENEYSGVELKFWGKGSKQKHTP